MKHISGLLTDFYELTMMQGYFLTGNNPPVVFDMFYRTQPFNNGYTVFAGLEEALSGIASMRFSEDDISFLRETGKFQESFLAYLTGFSFSGDIYAMDEGTTVFPGEPLIRVEASLIEAQLIESFLLNIVNFQSLIATKTSRVYMASDRGMIMEFGLRRAQGINGAHAATRAAYIGGASVTSNTLSGKDLGIPVSGTMAHSWVMAFSSELEAFRKYAEIYPAGCVFLIDTYDTLGSGIDNAITVGCELKEKGYRIGVRIDSGDLSYLSRRVRSRLDAAGLEDAFIAVSNDLTEEIISMLVADDVPIDSWGVGTHLVTGGVQSSLNGVYKLAAKMDDDGQMQPTMKVSNNYEKTTNPGIKQVYRFYDDEQNAIADLITLDDEKLEVDRKYTFFHPMIDKDLFFLKEDQYKTIVPLLSCKMRKGIRVGDPAELSDIKEKVAHHLGTLHKSYKRLMNPHIYKVSLSKELKDLKQELLSIYRSEQ